MYNILLSPGPTLTAMVPRTCVLFRSSTQTCGPSFVYGRTLPVLHPNSFARLPPRSWRVCGWSSFRARTSAADKPILFAYRRTSAADKHPFFAHRRTSAADKRILFAYRRTSAADKPISFAYRRTSAADKCPLFAYRRTSAADKHPLFAYRRTSAADKPILFAYMRTTAGSPLELRPFVRLPPHIRGRQATLCSLTRVRRQVLR